MSLFLTTQPGWAWATLAELRRLGVGGYVPFSHRDSSLVAPAPRAGTWWPDELRTPADVWGLLLETAGDGRDATAAIEAALSPRRLRATLSRWGDTSGVERYSVGSEVWGETALHRRVLQDVLRSAVGAALPRWRYVASGGVRFFCKADARVGLVGVRLSSNLDPGEGERTGTLREHLACGLLELAGTGAAMGMGTASGSGKARGETVLDPFMGSGTILRAAWRHYGIGRLIGYDVDGDAVRLARAGVVTPATHLEHDSFEACRPERLPAGTRLVSNLPFGARFREVPLARLLPFVERCLRYVAGTALLLGREQGERVAEATGLGRKNVLVLGQPASIVYTGETGGAPDQSRARVRS